jgi:hypothetical protein
MCLASRLVRGAGLDRNPLRRRVDYVQAWTRVALLVSFLVLTPILAWHMGRSAYHRGVAAERTARFPAVAVLTQPAPDITTGDEALLGQVAVPIRWTDRTGGAHTAQTLVDPGLPAGDTIPVWTDEAGNLAGAPRGPDGSDRVAGIRAGILAGFVPAVLLAGCEAGLGLLLNRIRLARWTAGWRRVEPDWSGRH